MANQKNATLKALIQGVIYELMPKGSVYNIYVDDETTLAAKLAEVIASLNDKVKQEDLEAALAEVQLFGNTPVAADQALGQEVPELLSQGDGIAVDVTDTLTIAALKDELHILAELLGGLIGQQTDQDKAHGDNDQKCQKHEQDTFHNVFCHIHNKFPPLIFFTDRGPSGTG